MLLTAQCLAQSHSPDDSSTAGNVYINFYFQFRYPFSASWVPQLPVVAEQLQHAGRARLGDSAKQPSPSDKVYPLLTLFRNLPGEGPNGRSRAVFQVLAQDVSTRHDIPSGKEFVLMLSEVMKKAHYDPVGEPQEIKISGRTFFRQDLKGTNSSGAPVFQSAVFTVSKNYALGFLLVAPTQAFLTGMLATLDKVEFY